MRLGAGIRRVPELIAYIRVGRLYADACVNRYVFWLRICSVLVHAKDIRRHPLMFSERNGYTRRKQVGNWSIKVERVRY